MSNYWLVDNVFFGLGSLVLRHELVIRLGEIRVAVSSMIMKRREFVGKVVLTKAKLLI